MTPADRLYAPTDGGNAFIEFLRMGWLRPRDNHAADAWRAQVFNFLQSELVAENNAGTQALPLTRRHTSSTTQVSVLSLEDLVRQNDGQRLNIGPAHAIICHRPFSLNEDRCVASSYDDYKENRCWICQEQPSCETWDLWLSCRHLYCAKCSTKMLQRRMPCPLCRVASSVVFRGKQYDGSGGTEESGTSDTSAGSTVPLMGERGAHHGPGL